MGILTDSCSYYQVLIGRNETICTSQNPTTYILRPVFTHVCALDHGMDLMVVKHSEIDGIQTNTLTDIYYILPLDDPKPLAMVLLVLLL